MKRLKNLFLAGLSVVAGLAGSTAHAGAVLTISGKVYSISPYEYQIRTQRSVYHLDRRALTKSQIQQLGKPEQMVTISVPMSAIVKVRSADQIKQ